MLGELVKFARLLLVIVLVLFKNEMDFFDHGLYLYKLILGVSESITHVLVHFMFKSIEFFLLFR